MMDDQDVVCIGIFSAVGFLVFSYLVMWIFGDFPLVPWLKPTDESKDD